MNQADDSYGELDELAVFRALEDHDVDYVLVGGSAGILWGAQRGTRDDDCVADQSVDNFRRLCGALIQLGNPRLRIEGLDDAAATELSSQLLHPDFFERTEFSTWRTDCGSIDVLRNIPGADGAPVAYSELRERATVVVTQDLRIAVASLDDIIESKLHSNRVKDRAALPELEQLRNRKQQNPPSAEG